MKLEAKFRREDKEPRRPGGHETTTIWIDILVDDDSSQVSSKVFISGYTSDIGHLDPNTNSLEEYREAVLANRKWIR